VSDRLRPLAAEALGTALLLIAIVGSGITVSTDETLPAQLFQHAVVVGLALAVIVRLLQPVSGAHLNPVVTMVDAALGGRPWRRVPAYVAAQVAGGVAGVAVTNALFGRPALEVATTVRAGGALLGSEVLATFGLVLVIVGLVRTGSARAVAPAVGAYVAAAIVLTPSASFANPAVTLARTLTDTFTGIAPGGAPGFVAAQVAGAGLAALVGRWLFVAVPAPSSTRATGSSTEKEPSHR
jgi:glycerol uptake facilitator-like aquaporin